jgi:hypothetical protein
MEAHLHFLPQLQNVFLVLIGSDLALDDPMGQSVK